MGKYADDGIVIQSKEELSNKGIKIFLEVCVIPSAVSTQGIASNGIDTVILDQEHDAVLTNQLNSIFGMYISHEIIF